MQFLTRKHNDAFDGAEPGALLLTDSQAVYTPGISEHRSTGSLFYNNDALGSLRNIVNSSNAMTDDERFDAFGMTVYHGGQSPTTTPYGFVGKKGYQTDTSGLMLLGHRYYDAGIGRFLSRDPIHDGSNWYAYCGNNPLGKSDPTGLSDATPNPPGWNDQWTQDNDNDFVSPNGDKWHWDPRGPGSSKDADHDNHWDVTDKGPDGRVREQKYFPDRNNGAGEYKEKHGSSSRTKNYNNAKEQAAQNRTRKAANDARARQGQAPKQFHPYVVPAPSIGPTPTFRMSPEEMPTIRIFPLEELFPIPG